MSIDPRHLEMAIADKVLHQGGGSSIDPHQPETANHRQASCYRCKIPSPGSNSSLGCLRCGGTTSSSCCIATPGCRKLNATSFADFEREDNSILGFDDEEVEGIAHGGGEGYGLSCVPEPKSSVLYENTMMGSFPLQSAECINLLVEREVEHLPRVDYTERLLTGGLDQSIRRDAIDWIGKVHAYYGFGPLSAYLSVNYLDRFLSEYELPQGKAWMTQLLAVACLSLAAKMEETEVPLSLDLQVGESKYVFEARTIQRMELLVLSTLKWRMQAVTPLSFIDYFLQKFNGGNSPTQTSISRSVELILSMIKGIDFLAFKPSEVAAAVTLSVLGESQSMKAEKSVTCYKYVEKDRVLRCYEMIQELYLMRNRPPKRSSPTVSSVPQSPNGVLDAACLSYRSDDATVGSEANFHHSPLSVKRRKISRQVIS